MACLPSILGSLKSVGEETGGPFGRDNGVEDREFRSWRFLKRGVGVFLGPGLRVEPGRGGRFS